MQRIQKSGYEAPDISFFVPSLADQLGEREANHVEPGKREGKWQPRWTILFSLTAGGLLWAGIVLLIRL
jgi:hypothetical protein